MEWFDPANIDEIYLQWYNVKGIDTNFQAFAAVFTPADPVQGDNRETAAKATPSYKIISKWNFTTITDIDISPNPQNFDSVTVTVEK